MAGKNNSSPREGLTFDDVLIKPGLSEVLPADVDIRSRVTRSIPVNIPIIASAMDTVTEAQMAIAMHDKVLIVDFGSQVTQLIARRVREEKVYSEIVPYQKAEAAFREMKPKAIILSGGPASVLDKDAPLAPKAIYDAGIPVLGICYGEQAMAHQLGGQVEGGHHREFGRAEVTVTEESPLFEGVWRKGEKYPVWMSHGDRVTKLPKGFHVFGTSPNAPIAIIGDDKRKFYATQFHLEVMHTPHGAAILRNFVRKIAGLKGDWTMCSSRFAKLAPASSSG